MPCRNLLSRSTEKFANNLSELIIGKDPLKEIFIVFERAVAAKSEQVLKLANKIKDDTIPPSKLRPSTINNSLNSKTNKKLSRISGQWYFELELGNK